MHSYTSGSMIAFIFWGSFCLFIGAIFACVGSAFLLEIAFDFRSADVGEKAILGAASLGAGIYLMLVGRRFVWSSAYRVVVRDDGSLEFVALVRTQTLFASDLVAIERRFFPLPLRGTDPRDIAFRSLRGSAHVFHFDATETLIREVQAMNPSIAIRGSWG